MMIYVLYILHQTTLGPFEPYKGTYKYANMLCAMSSLNGDLLGTLLFKFYY